MTRLPGGVREMSLHKNSDQETENTIKLVNIFPGLIKLIKTLLQKQDFTSTDTQQRGQLACFLSRTCMGNTET